MSALILHHYDISPYAEKMVYADAHEIAIRRRDERVGEVVVHFPKEGMLIMPESS